jgi:hypothetical protein
MKVATFKVVCSGQRSELRGIGCKMLGTRLREHSGWVRRLVRSFAMQSVGCGQNEQKRSRAASQRFGKRTQKTGKPVRFGTLKHKLASGARTR